MCYFRARERKNNIFGFAVCVSSVDFSNISLRSYAYDCVHETRCDSVLTAYGKTSQGKIMCSVMGWGAGVSGGGGRGRWQIVNRYRKRKSEATCYLPARTYAETDLRAAQERIDLSHTLESIKRNFYFLYTECRERKRGVNRKPILATLHDHCMHCAGRRRDREREGNGGEREARFDIPRERSLNEINASGAYLYVCFFLGR